MFYKNEEILLPPIIKNELFFFILIFIRVKAQDPLKVDVSCVTFYVGKLRFIGLFRKDNDKIEEVKFVVIRESILEGVCFTKNSSWEEAVRVKLLTIRIQREC